MAKGFVVRNGNKRKNKNTEMHPYMNDDDEGEVEEVEEELNELERVIESVGENPNEWKWKVILIHTSGIIGFIFVMFALTATEFMEKMMGGFLAAAGIFGWLIGAYLFIHQDITGSKYNEYIKVLKHYYFFCKDLDGYQIPVYYEGKRA